MRRRPIETPLPPEVLELVADIMLASAARDVDRPTYDEAELSQIARRSLKAEIFLRLITGDQITPEEPADDFSLETISQDELAIWQMHRQGVSKIRIAERLRVNPQKVRRVIRNNVMGMPEHEERLQELGKVYRSEVNRRGYHRPAHCTNEPCQKLGYCRYKAGCNE